MANIGVNAATGVKRAKAEIEEEFSRIQDEVRTARESADPQADELGRHKEGEIRPPGGGNEKGGAVEGLSVDGVVEQISRLGVEISRSLSGISEKLVEEVNRLAALRSAVLLERQEMERLHKIDVAATALDQMVLDFQRQKEELEAEIAARKAEWEESAQTAERERKEQEEALKKQRQREIDDYEYKKNLERKRAQDKYEEEQRQQERKNQEKQEALQKGWAQREAALREQEEELSRLRKEVAEFPSRIQLGVEQAAVQAAKDAKAQAEEELVLAKREAEAEKRIAELRIKALEEAAARQNAQIADMQRQVDEPRKQVQEIAVPAIEGAPDAKTLAHVEEIAMEQVEDVFGGRTLVQGLHQPRSGGRG
jgi:colicin import membrane protein